ncbi:MAG: hypothetical protein ACSHWZ_13980 [Sulfitobacter sp.]
MPQRIIVVYNDPVVMMDLVQTLQSVVPAAKVESFFSFEEAEKAAEGGAPADLLIAAAVEGPMSLARYLIRISADVGELCAKAGQSVVLPSPFTSEMFSEALLMLGFGGRPLSQPEVQTETLA